MSTHWSRADRPDLSGQTVVVTGANSGLGEAAASAFAGAGADVVMACRSTDRGAAARARLLADGPAGRLTVAECDLADLESVASFADRVRAEHDSVDILCNNAGVMAIPRRETADGFEYQFGVNHLGHFALTAHLLDHLRAADGARVVTQSSRLHRRGTPPVDDWGPDEPYDRWRAYAQSKLANLLFALELHRRLAAAGTDVASLGCHPGWAATRLQRRGPAATGSRLRLWAMGLANRLFAQSAARGAWPMLHAATADALDGGEYVGPGGVLHLRGAPERQPPSDAARDPVAARQLWARSTELTGVAFDL